MYLPHDITNFLPMHASAHPLLVITTTTLQSGTQMRAGIHPCRQKNIVRKMFHQRTKLPLSLSKPPLHTLPENTGRTRNVLHTTRNLTPLPQTSLRR